MYYFFALAAGVLISLMAVFNGRLTAEAGLCLTTAIIHVVAIIFALIILWIKKESFIPKQKLPLWRSYKRGVHAVQQLRVWENKPYCYYCTWLARTDAHKPCH